MREVGIDTPIFKAHSVRDSTVAPFKAKVMPSYVRTPTANLQPLVGCGHAPGLKKILLPFVHEQKKPLVF